MDLPVTHFNSLSPKPLVTQCCSTGVEHLSKIMVRFCQATLCCYTWYYWSVDATTNLSRPWADIASLKQSDYGHRCSIRSCKTRLVGFACLFAFMWCGELIMPFYCLICIVDSLIIATSAHQSWKQPMPTEREKGYVMYDHNRSKT